MRDLCANSVYPEPPLESARTQIRLLRLNPGRSDDTGGPVEGTLIRTELTEAPSYEALSYHWGKETLRKTVIVNGQTAGVQENLESALRHLRRLSEPRLLWIDALCIDQSNTEERNAQVSIMHAIYRKALRTVAWLGDGREDGEFALEYLDWDSRRKSLTNPPDMDDRGSAYETRGLEATQKLLQRPYWRRLWVMQEIALSSTAPHVVCGRAWLSWAQLTTALANEPSASYVNRLQSIRGATQKFMQQKPNSNPKRIGRHVVLLLSHSAGFETSEPRDRVYALYGLFRVVGIVGFVPDYRMSIAQVYQQLTEYVITMKNGLDVLELRPHDQDPELPSWVVDFSKRPPLSYERGNTAPWQRLEQRNTGCNKQSPLVDPSSLTLKVSGVTLDEVVQTEPVNACVAKAFYEAAKRPSARIFGGHSLRSDNSAALRYWETRVDPAHPVEICRHTIDFLSRWQSVIAYFVETGTRADNRSPQSWNWTQLAKDAPVCLVQDKQVLKANEHQSQQLPTVRRSDVESMYRETLDPLLSSLSIMMQGRICFVTKFGLHGVSLIGASAGDIIVAVQSTKHLHVLRPSASQSRRYQYVGAAIISPSQPTHEGRAQLDAMLSNIRNGEALEQDFILH